MRGGVLEYVLSLRLWGFKQKGLRGDRNYDQFRYRLRSGICEDSAHSAMSQSIDKNYRWINTILSVVIAGLISIVGGIWMFRGTESFKKSTAKWLAEQTRPMEWKSSLAKSPFEFEKLNTKDLFKGTVLTDEQMRQISQIRIPPPRITIPTYQPPQIPRIPGSRF